MQRLLSVFFVIIFLRASRIGIAQEPKEEIRKLLKEIEEKFNQGDAKGLAACWTPGGDFGTHIGDLFEGRDNIEKAFQESFSAHEKASLQIHVLSLRIVSDGLAIVDVIPEMKPQTKTLAGEPNLNLVLVKRVDEILDSDKMQWLIQFVISKAQKKRGKDWNYGEDQH